MLDELLEYNKQWADAQRQAKKSYFKTLSQSQAPEYLWIGCSDSRVPAEVILGLDPGKIFVHRNVANQVQVDDNNSMSVLQYAVTVLKVKHIVVCGHYHCGGVRAAFYNEGTSYLGKWLNPIKELANEHQPELAACTDEVERIKALAVLNVRRQVDTLVHHPILLNAWKQGKELSVHGWMFDMNVGLLNDLNVTVTEPPRDGLTVGFSGVYVNG